MTGLAACGGRSHGGGTPCTTVGATSPCICAGGRTGVEVCGATLTYGACACGGVDLGLPDTGTPDGGGPDGGGSCVPGATKPVDILLVVDDSPSMVEEQASLTSALPEFLRALTTGDLNGDGTAEQVPIVDVHVGVITVNMGVAGIPNVPTCMRNPDFGDDGILLTIPRVGGVGCMTSYPAFLSFMAGTSDLAAFSADVACIARTGATGCGFEQQLDAALKAVLPSGDPTTFAEGTHGHGDEANAGFLRADSIVVVAILTDEDDCSTDQTDIWNPVSATHTGDLNLRCINYDSELYSTDRFFNGLKSLRPRSYTTDVIYATLAGVPEDLVALAPGETVPNYPRLFADPRMMNHVTVMGGISTLDAACSTPGRGNAAPGIRMIRVAQSFGETGIVGSICSADDSPVLSQIAARIGKSASCTP